MKDRNEQMQSRGSECVRNPAPRVSVVIPNFNYARYLEARIQSVLNQTYQDFEVILLDDASTDHSAEVIAKYSTNPRVITRFNTSNSGCVFKQWNLGVQMARGEYVWFAEADDLADPALLESLVRVLDANPEVGIAYCQSWKIDSGGKFLGTWQSCNDRWNSDRWNSDFINNGRDEIRKFLVRENTIPNASAVVFRRNVYNAVSGAPEWLKLTGDWYTWVRMMQISDIAFVARPMNNFRQHHKSVRETTASMGRGATEVYKVFHYIVRSEAIDFTTLKELQLWFRGMWLEPSNFGQFGKFGLRKSIRTCVSALTVDPGSLIVFLSLLTTSIAKSAKSSQLKFMAGLRSVLRKLLRPGGYQWLRTIVKGPTSEHKNVK